MTFFTEIRTDVYSHPKSGYGCGWAQKIWNIRIPIPNPNPYPNPNPNAKNSKLFIKIKIKKLQEIRDTCSTQTITS